MTVPDRAGTPAEAGLREALLALLGPSHPHDEGLREEQWERYGDWLVENGLPANRRAAAVQRAMLEPALLAAPAPGGLDEAVIEDAMRWRAAEAEGHVVDFTETGFGLQHPPSCRPNLIGCRFNVWLSDADGPEEEPGRYRMTWTDDEPEYARLAGEEET